MKNGPQGFINSRNSLSVISQQQLTQFQNRPRTCNPEFKRTILTGSCWVGAEIFKIRSVTKLIVVLVSSINDMQEIFAVGFLT